jgi:hypothetical protein
VAKPIIKTADLGFCLQYASSWSPTPLFFMSDKYTFVCSILYVLILHRYIPYVPMPFLILTGFSIVMPVAGL